MTVTHCTRFRNRELIAVRSLMEFVESRPSLYMFCGDGLGETWLLGGVCIVAKLGNNSQNRLGEILFRLQMCVQRLGNPGGPIRPGRCSLLCHTHALIARGNGERGTYWIFNGVISANGDLVTVG